MSDDTTTQLDPDAEDDKMLLLNGSERLKYFTDEFPAITASTPRNRSGVVKYISKLFN